MSAFGRDGRLRQLCGHRDVVAADQW